MWNLWFPAIEVSKDIPGLEIEQLFIDSLPFVNTDLEVGGRFPEPVEAFRAKVLTADSILFASTEYNYSVSGRKKIQNAHVFLFSLFWLLWINISFGSLQRISFPFWKMLRLFGFR
jgi:hypothetical protein